MKPEDLELELERLWARVSGPSVAPEPLLPPPSRAIGTESSPAGEAALEALALVKRQHRDQQAQWEEMLELKEKAVSELSARLRETESELISARRKTQQAEAHLFESVSDAANKLESTRDSMKLQEERFAKEERVLRDTADKFRQELDAERKRFKELERQWNEREQQYLSDLHEIQERLAKSEAESGAHQKEGRRLSDSLQESKGAIESTLSELLAERKLRETSDQELEKALRKVSETEQHLHKLQEIWEAERKQWQELWDRERSTWESQRQELSSWEERLRQEREAWHARLKVEEEREVKFAEQMAATLRQSTEGTAKLGALIRAWTGAPSGVTGPGRRPWVWKFAAGALVLGFLAWTGLEGWRYFTRVRIILESTHPAALGNPTAVAFDGSALWVADWGGKLLTLDPADPSRIVSRHDITKAGPYRPVALDFGRDALWSLDAAQGRVLKHGPGDISAVQVVGSAPGPAPMALADDGKNLWIYDAVTKNITRHPRQAPLGQGDPLTLDLDVVPASMHWLQDELWLHDAKGRRIVRMKAGDKVFETLGVLELDSSTVSIAAVRAFDGKAYRRSLWALSGSPGSYSLQKYKISP